MVQVEIVPSLEEAIHKHFKAESIEVLQYLKTLEDSPNKGKALGHVGGIIIKELKYQGFRFYFITDAHKLRLFTAEALAELLVRFVRMSDKKDQQATIEEIKYILKTIGPLGFE